MRNGHKVVGTCSSWKATKGFEECARQKLCSAAESDGGFQTGVRSLILTMFFVQF